MSAAVLKDVGTRVSPCSGNSQKNGEGASWSSWSIGTINQQAEIWGEAGAVGTGGDAALADRALMLSAAAWRRLAPPSFSTSTAMEGDQGLLPLPFPTLSWEPAPGKGKVGSAPATAPPP